MDQQHLCNSCNSFTLDDLRSGHMLYSDVDMLVQEIRREKPCSLCSLVWRSLRFDKFFFLKYGAVYLFLNPPPRHTHRFDKLQCIDVIATSADVSKFLWCPRTTGEPWHLGPPDYKGDIHRGRLTVYSDRGNFRENEFKHRVPFNNSGTDDCFLLVKQWLDECLQNHGSACQRDAVKLPTRLLDVGPADGSVLPKLIVTEEAKFPNPKSVKYVALSYCWGQDTFLTTRSSTLQNFMASITWNKLPKTIRDAISVTRRLGIQYLWVDALCIIQGNNRVARSDWQSESAKMHHIYGGAFLTLSAAHAAHANEGLFHQRDVEPASFCALKLAPDEPETVVLGLDPPPLLAHLEALNTRAWALQERLLSNRVLSYGSTGLRWMCYQSLHHETTPQLGHQGFSVVETEAQRNRADKSPATRSTREDKPFWISKEWKAIIEQFTQRDLTNITDKLPALSGLTQMANKSCNDKYFAGLWQSDVLQQLMWIHYGRRTSFGIKYKRQSQFRAPSWSWASVDGSVKFLYNYETLPGALSHCSLDTERSQRPREMLRCPLKIFGRTRMMPSIRCEHAARYNGGAERHTPWISYPVSLRTYLDDLDALPRSQVQDLPNGPKMLLNPLFLFLGWKEDYAGIFLAGIILIANKFGSKFKRVGAFEGFEASEATLFDYSQALKRGNEERWVSIL